MHVPDGWRKLHLIDVLDGSIRNGYSPNASDTETGYYVLGLGALGDSAFNINEVKPVKPTKEVRQSLLQVGDFLISRSNTPDKVGRSIRFKGELSNCSYPDLMMRFRIDCNKADPNFIEAKLKSSSVRGYFKNCAAGSSGTMVKINKSVVEKTPLLLPSRPEQQKIAKILSTWDKTIEKLETLIAAKQKRKKALMQQLLTGKKRFAGFDGEWKKVKLSEIIYEIKKETIKEPNKYELLTVKLHCKGAVRSGKYPTPTVGGRPYFLREQGELIIGRQNLHNGGVAIVPKESAGCVASNAISSFEIKGNNSKLFILYRMSLPKFFSTIDNLVGGTGQKEISVKELMKIKIRIPKSEEQQKIASVLSAADIEIETHQKQLAALKEQKRGLMQRLLTGKKRVRIDVPEQRVAVGA